MPSVAPPPLQPGAAPAGKDATMLDLALVAAAAIGFALLAGYAALCERL
jgi:hypothetical protein